MARNVEPIAMPETTEEYQKEFDLLIKQVQCKGMSFKIYFQKFFKILFSKNYFRIQKKSVYQTVRRYYFYPAVIYRFVLNVPDNYRKIFVPYAGAQLNI